MNFLALLLGLALERVLTHLFHLREFHWLDPLFDTHLRRLRSASGGMGRRWAALALTGLLAVLLVAPVALLSEALQDEFLQIPSFLFAVVVLLFSLGPRDLDDEVEDYADALSTGDLATQQQVAGELLEGPPPELPAERNEAIERAIYVQANNRIFGVVFWFLVLGPTGAWAFRVLDLLRHRAEQKAGDEGATPAMEAVRTLHGLLAFLPRGCSHWVMRWPAISKKQWRAGETLAARPHFHSPKARRKSCRGLVSRPPVAGASMLPMPSKPWTGSAVPGRWSCAPSG